MAGFDADVFGSLTGGGKPAFDADIFPAPSEPPAVPTPAGPSDAYKEGAGARRIVKNTLSQLQGPAFGFLDELGGAIVGGAKTLYNGKPFSQNYQDVRDYVRGASDQAMKDEPGRNLAGRVLLSAPIGMGLPQAFGAATLPARMGSAAVTGGAAGVVSGIGDTTHTPFDNPLDFAKDVGQSAMYGMGFPMFAVPVAEGLGGAAKAVASRVSDSAAWNYAREKLAEAFLRDAPPGVSNMVPRAVQRLNVLGPEATVADAGGANVRAQLDLLATLPGQTKQRVEQMINQRQAGRAGRMIGAADEGLDAGGVRLSQAVQDLIDARRATATPLYQRVQQMTIDPSPALRSIVRAADQIGALNEARTMATAEQVPFTLGASAGGHSHGGPAAPQMSGAGPIQILDDAGSVMSTWSPGGPAPQPWSMRDLDLVKRGIDKKIEDSKNLGAPTALTRSLTMLKQSLVGELDAAVPLYAQARAAYEAPTTLIQAAEAGRKSLTLTDDGIRATTRLYSPEELQAYRTGAYEALRQKLGTESGQTQIMKMWKEPATRERLQALFGDERSFREFASTVAAERRLKLLEATGRGSQTAARQYAAGDLDVPAIKQFGAAAVDAKTGNVPGLFANVRGAWNRVQTPEPVRDAMGGLLLQRGPDAQAGLLSVQEIANEVARNRTRQAGALGLLGSLW